MAKQPFREYHLIEILSEYDEQNLPLDLHISRYFRAHKAIGSKDRGYIADMVYALVRWKGLIDHQLKGRPDWEKRFLLFAEMDLEGLSQERSIPPHIRVSYPEELFECMVASHGMEAASALCYASNYPAPTTVRANTLKLTRDELLQRWQGLYPVAACHFAPHGINFEKKLNFFILPEFQQGCFEVQDEGSQLLAGLVDAKPGQQVLDYCSGSGGKTLAFAPSMQNSGQIFLHDVRPHVLIESRRRLRRAGVQNAQIVPPEDPRLKRMKKRMDWVLVDVPCSGTGTLRRNPDMKWKFDLPMLNRLVGLQRQIFEKGLSYLKPGGKIVYGTCSLLKEENQVQIEHFMHAYDLELVAPPFQSLPVRGGMDGFFGAVLQKRLATKAIL